MSARRVFTFSDTSPSSASTAVGATAINGLEDYDWFHIDAKIVGGTGGTIDVLLQRETGEAGSEAWRDWCRFPQVAAAATKYYSAQSGSNTTISEVSASTTAVIAANTFLGGHPGSRLRAVYTAGAGTSAGAVQDIKITGWKRRV